MKVIFLLLLTAASVVGCAIPPTMKVRVYEVACKGKWTSDANCAGSLVLGSELEYVLNERTSSVGLKVVRNNGDWYTAGLLYTQCKIVDDDNWSCGDDIGDRHGMYGGKYERSHWSLYGSYRFVGIAGYRYWWAHFTKSPGDPTTL